ncbi:hypothetical protein BT69DRAFT_1301457 [Atractiella rhizophila]|nr:hypothetical protein BT69DRAFT_1301457 [Atractiella rhizophila]
MKRAIFAAVALGIVDAQELLFGVERFGKGSWECSNPSLCSQGVLPWFARTRGEHIKVSSYGTLSRTVPVKEGEEYAITFSAAAVDDDMIATLIQFGDFHMTVDVYPNFNGFDDYTVFARASGEEKLTLTPLSSRSIVVSSISIVPARLHRKRQDDGPPPSDSPTTTPPTDGPPPSDSPTTTPPTDGPPPSDSPTTTPTDTGPPPTDSPTTTPTDTGPPPTDSPTTTPTDTPTTTPTDTGPPPTDSPTTTPTDTPTTTPTDTGPPPTDSPTTTPTGTTTIPTDTSPPPTDSPTTTPTDTPTTTPTGTGTNTPTTTPTGTNTPPTDTPTTTPTNTPTGTNTPTTSPTNTGTDVPPPTDSPTGSPTATTPNPPTITVPTVIETTSVSTPAGGGGEVTTVVEVTTSVGLVPSVIVSTSVATSAGTPTSILVSSTTTIVVALPTATPTPPSNRTVCAPNLVVNGGFEASNTSFAPFECSTAGACALVDGTNVTGIDTKYATLANFSTLNYETAAVAGTNYTVSFQAFVTDVDSVDALVQFGSFHQTISILNVNASGTVPFQNITFYSVAAGNDTFGITPLGAATLGFTNLEISNAAAVCTCFPNLLSDGGFTLSTTSVDPWTCARAPGSNSSLCGVDSGRSIAPDGDGSYGTLFNFTTLSQGTAAEAGVNYTVSFYAFALADDPIDTLVKFGSLNETVSVPTGTADAGPFVPFTFIGTAAGNDIFSISPQSVFTLRIDNITISDWSKNCTNDITVSTNATLSGAATNASGNRESDNSSASLLQTSTATVAFFAVASLAFLL